MAELKIISMDEVQSKEVNWLWYQGGGMNG